VLPGVLIDWHTGFSRELAQPPGNTTGVLLTHAPSVVRQKSA